MPLSNVSPKGSAKSHAHPLPHLVYIEGGAGPTQAPKVGDHLSVKGLGTTTPSSLLTVVSSTTFYLPLQPSYPPPPPRPPIFPQGGGEGGCQLLRTAVFLQLPSFPPFDRAMDQVSIKTPNPKCRLFLKIN